MEKYINVNLNNNELTENNVLIKYIASSITINHTIYYPLKELSQNH